MIDRAVVRVDCDIKVQSDVIEACCNKSHDRDEPNGGASGALEHAKPFVNSGRGTNGS